MSSPESSQTNPIQDTERKIQLPIKKLEPSNLVERILVSTVDNVQKIEPLEERDIGTAVYTYTYLSNGKNIGGYLVAQEALLQKNEPLPVIINNRGGTQDIGTIKYQQLYGFVGRGIAQQLPCIVIGTQFPGNEFSEGKDTWGGEEDIAAIDDLFPLALQLAQNLKIGMFSWSRGGAMTYLFLIRSLFAKYVNCAMVVAGTADLFETVEKVPDMEEHFRDAFGMTIIGLIERSAVFWAKKFPNNTPLLIVQGGLDDRVPPEGPKRLAEALKYLGKAVEWLFIKNADHGLLLHNTNGSKEKFDWPSLLKEWFSKHLYQ